MARDESTDDVRSRDGELRLATDVRTLQNRGVVAGHGTLQALAAMPKELRNQLVGGAANSGMTDPTTGRRRVGDVHRL